MPDVDTPLIDLSKGFFSGKDQTDEKPKRSSSQAPKKRSPLPPWKNGVISDWAANLYLTAGKLIEPFDKDYGSVLQGISTNAGQAWENLARDNPTVRRAIHSLMTTTRTSELIMAHVPLIIITLHRHGPIKQQFDNVARKVTEHMESVDVDG